jgi:Histidine kinase-, DNA gyrase B-, and HSP90-like ATPase
MTSAVQRTVFATPRAAEFVELRALQAQTGQSADAFGGVVVKELIDNALDAAESAGVAPVIEIEVSTDDGITYITVTDNGNGITPATIADVCDFNVLASDKARYRGPSRGAQGNALKTLLGIPAALGVDEPVIIDSGGVRHQLHVYVDAAGDVMVDHDTSPGRTEGTSVTVPLPDYLDIDAARWALGAALVNPHASITASNPAYTDDDNDPVFYKPAGQEWSKWTPSQPSNPHWYDQPAFAGLVNAYIWDIDRTGVDKPLGGFIAEFEGLRGSGKQRVIRQVLPGITHLSQLQGRDDLVAVLHTAMREHAKPTPRSRLGAVGKDQFESLLDGEYWVRRPWYKKAELTVDGVSWVIEVGVADTVEPGEVFYAVNHGPSFGDPLGQTWLDSDDVNGMGAGSFLAGWQLGAVNRAAVVHVICAAAQYTDKGKVTLVVPDEVADAAAKALAGATKALRREAEQRRKDAARADQAERRRLDEAERGQREKRYSKKEAVFEVIPEAREAAIGERGRSFAARTLFYKVRGCIRRFGFDEADLDYDYFSQKLLPMYEREVGPIEGLYYKGRGILRHPHDDKFILLGTREVDAYDLPEWQFDKVLYVEKEGLDEQLAPYEIRQRYDIATIFSEGYSVTACRRLLARFAARDIKIFVLHDADIAGYNIARTLGDATERMPDHHIEIIDLGLTVPQALDPDLPGAGGEPLPTERFARQNELPSTLEFDPDALEWFTGEPFSAGWGKTHWRGTRCELNAFSADGLAEFIEAGLQRHGVTKLVPPPGVLGAHVLDARDEALKDLVASIVDIDAVVRKITDTNTFTDITEAQIRDMFTESPTEPWRAVTEQLVQDGINDIDGLNDQIRGLITERLDDDEDE